ncbi:MAG: glycoside hydrolase [Aureispira sp.]|nr:glycoside hydrolase [Aureispira sp.]
MNPISKTLVFFILSLGIINLTACSHEADNYPTKGIDISHYQKRIDWKKFKENNLEFVLVKATEGGFYKDSLFQHNWKNLDQLPVVKGAYHFFRPKVAVQQQIQNFIEAVDLQSGDLVPVLDIEVTDKVTTDLIVRDIRIWLQYIENHYNAKPIVYTYKSFYEQHLKGQIDNPIWIAYYNRSAATDIPWEFWQYSDNGSIQGIDGAVDLNVFFGKKEELQQYCLP